MVEQVCHIENYRKVVYQAEGLLLRAEEAAMEWISKYASQYPDAGASLLKAELPTPQQPGTGENVCGTVRYPVALSNLVGLQLPLIA
jgi:hypothetical protein